MTNGNGGPETPASGLPLNGGGGSLGGGPMAVGQGQGGPGAGNFGGPGGPGDSGPGGPPGQPGLPVPVSAMRRGGGPAGGPVAANAGANAGSAGAMRTGSRFALSNWRVRWRLIA